MMLLSPPVPKEGYFVTTCALLSIAFAVGAAELLACFLDESTCAKAKQDKAGHGKEEEEEETDTVVVNKPGSSGGEKLRRRRPPPQRPEESSPKTLAFPSQCSAPTVLKWIVLGCLASCPLASVLQNGWLGGCMRRNDGRSETIVNRIVSSMPPKSTLFTKVRSEDRAPLTVVGEVQGSHRCT